MSTFPGRPPARLAVDLSAALNLVGSLVAYLGPAALVPAVFAAVHDEPVWPFLVAGAIVTGAGLGIQRVTRHSGEVGIREGYLVVCLVWLSAAVFGALPFVLAGDAQLGRPVDALFEAMSGFTTTGASVTTDLDELSMSMKIWRQLMTWLGGIGVVALAIAVLPRLRVGGRQMLESELSGPGIDSLSARLRDTVRRFATLYVGLTALAFLALGLPGWLGAADGMDTFQAFGHALSSISTAGFSTEPRSIGAFGALTQWTILALMVIGGTNFLLLHRALIQRRFREAVRDEELRLYLAVVLGAGMVLGVMLWVDGIREGEGALRSALFHATSAITTTGFSIEDYDRWPLMALMALVLLFFVGAMAGSTSGSIKIVRHLLLARLLRREVERTVHPELVRPARLNGMVVDQQVLLAVISFVLIYLAVFVGGVAVLAIESPDEFRALDLIAASAMALGNVGIGLGPAGATGSFATFGDGSTVTMTVLMWVGRLEIVPVVVLLRRSYWRL